MQILGAENHRRMPWKNGGGETIEIAVFPPTAGLDDFDWRVSMARVETDGPFSAFTGIDRTLTILDGAGLVLFIEGRDPITLTDTSEPLAFPADLPTRAELVDGPVTDLNVMTRRGRLTHQVSRRDIEGELDLALLHATNLLFCLRGSLHARERDGGIEIGPQDALVLEGDTVCVEGRGTICLIGIDDQVWV